MPEYHVDNPALLIRLRIREKRLFEARFLFRQFDGEIGATERGQLDIELASLLSRVDKLQRQARETVTAGQRDKALELYRAIEEIAIDVPGLAEEKKGLEGAEAVVARITGKITAKATGTALSARSMAPQPQAAVQQVGPPSEGQEKPHRPATLRRWPRLWPAAACLGLLLILLLLFRGNREERPSSVIPPAASPPPSQKILIRPLASPAAPVAEQPESDTGPNEPASEAPASPPSLHLGTLQVEEAGHKER